MVLGPRLTATVRWRRDPGDADARSVERGVEGEDTARGSAEKGDDTPADPGERIEVASIAMRARDSRRYAAL
jgi:hypothetical protein